MNHNATIFFDCFGTLFSDPGKIDINCIIDIMPEISIGDKKNISKLWNQCYQEAEHKSRLSNIEFSMDDIAYKMSFLCRKYELATYLKLKDKYMEYWSEKIYLYPDVKESIFKLSKKYCLGIISNTHDCKLIPNLLEKNALSKYFTFLVFSIDVGYKKPSSQIFEYAKQICGNRALCYIGDDYINDIKGAQDNNIPSIYLNRNKEKVSITNVVNMSEIFEIIHEL